MQNTETKPTTIEVLTESTAAFGLPLSCARDPMSALRELANPLVVTPSDTRWTRSTGMTSVLR